MVIPKSCWQRPALAAVVKQNSGNNHEMLKKFNVTYSQSSAAVTTLIPPFSPQTTKGQPFQKASTQVL